MKNIYKDFLGFIWGLFLRKTRKSYETIQKANEQKWLSYADLQHVTKRQNKQKFQFVMSRPRVRVPLPAPRHGKPFGLSCFYAIKTRLRFVCCRSSFAKRHVCCGCVFVNADTTPLQNYHLFAIMLRLTAKSLQHSNKNRLEIQAVFFYSSDIASL